MGATKNGALSEVEAAWALALKLDIAPLTLEEAARIVAGCSNGDSAAWYALEDYQRTRFRGKARKVLLAGVDSGALRAGAIIVDGKREEVWEATKLGELPY